MNNEQREIGITEMAKVATRAPGIQVPAEQVDDLLLTISQLIPGVTIGEIRKLGLEHGLLPSSNNGEGQLSKGEEVMKIDVVEFLTEYPKFLAKTESVQQRMVVVLPFAWTQLKQGIQRVTREEITPALNNARIKHTPSDINNDILAFRRLYQYLHGTAEEQREVESLALTNNPVVSIVRRFVRAGITRERFENGTVDYKSEAAGEKPSRKKKAKSKRKSSASGKVKTHDEEGQIDLRAKASEYVAEWIKRSKVSPGTSLSQDAFLSLLQEVQKTDPKYSRHDLQDDLAKFLGAVGTDGRPKKVLKKNLLKKRFSAKAAKPAPGTDGDEFRQAVAEIDSRIAQRQGRMDTLQAEIVDLQAKRDKLMDAVDIVLKFTK